MKPREYQWFALFPLRELIDFEDLDSECYGMRLRLKFRAWSQQPACSLPDDDQQIARWLHVSETTWRKKREQVLRGCERKNGRIFFDDLVTERRRCDGWYAGRKRGADKVNALRKLPRSAPAERPLSARKEGKEYRQEGNTSTEGTNEARAEHPSVAEPPPARRASTDPERKIVSLDRSDSTDSDRPTGLRRLDVAELERVLEIISAIQNAMEAERTQRLPIDDALGQRLAEAAGDLSRTQIQDAVLQAIRRAPGPIRSGAFFEVVLREARLRAGAA